MGRVNTPILSSSQRKELEIGLKEGKSHSFRMRCQSILLKSEGRTSKEVGSITGMCHISVNSWLNRYKSEGVSGLSTKSGRGRKPILNREEDKAGILESIKANRCRFRRYPSTHFGDTRPLYSFSFPLKACQNYSFFLKLSPFNSKRCAECTNLSRIASAITASPITSNQLATGS